LRDRFTRWLTMPPLTDPIERRQAPVIQLMLLALLGVALLSMPFLIIDVAAPSSQRLSIFSNVVLILLLAAALVTLRRGRLRFAVILAALAFLPGQAISLLGAGTHESGLRFLIFILPLTLVGLLAKPWALLTTIAVMIAIVATTVMLEAQGSPLVGFAPAPSSPIGTVVIFALIIGMIGFSWHATARLRVLP
jgi:hypothetical protein